MRSLTIRALLALSIETVSLAHAATGAKRLNLQTKPVLRTGRFLAEVPLPTRVSVGPNYQSYLFELNSPENGEPSMIVKLSYRFALSEPEIPHDLLDYSLLHKFIMKRDARCDETWKALAQSYRFDEAGNYRGVDQVLLYSVRAPVTTHAQTELLPCYVVTPNDYRATLSGIDRRGKVMTGMRSDVAR